MDIADLSCLAEAGIGGRKGDPRLRGGDIERELAGVSPAAGGARVAGDAGE